MATTVSQNQTPAKPVGLKAKPMSNNRRFWRAFRRNKVAVAGLIIVVLMALGALLAPVIAPYDPITPNYTSRLVPPGSQFLLGSDELGRDLFTRLLYGARISLVIGFVAQGLAIGIGVVLGLFAGWTGGWIDDLIMRITDVFFAIPGLMFLIVWVTIFEPNPFSIFLALGLISWPSNVRMMRAQVLSVKELDYVLSARALGASTVRILFVHILPNAIGPMVVLASVGVAGVILSESILSFLGLGIQIPTPSWGTMVNTGKAYMTTAWWYSIFPGFIIMLTVLGFNFLGDGLLDALQPARHNK